MTLISYPPTTYSPNSQKTQILDIPYLYSISSYEYNCPIHDNQQGAFFLSFFLPPPRRIISKMVPS